jgi:ketosteroid isomerase-like protein
LNAKFNENYFMPTNEDVINTFYIAFSKLDAATMNSCYSNDIVFSDPAFGLLKGDEVRGMWQMLCTNAKYYSFR